MQDKDTLWKTVAGLEARSLDLLLDTAMIALSDLLCIQDQLFSCCERYPLS